MPDGLPAGLAPASWDDVLAAQSPGVPAAQKEAISQKITAEQNRGTQIAGELKPKLTPIGWGEIFPIPEPKKVEPPRKSANMADVGHGLKIGADVAAQDVRELVGRVPGIGPSIVSALDRADEYWAGKSSDPLLKGDIESQTKAMSPEQQTAGQRRWDTLGPESAWRDWRSYTGGLAQSIPEQAVMMFPAMRLAMGAKAAALAKGATEQAAAQTAARVATIAGSAIEGPLGGAQSSRQVRDDIMALKEPELQDSEALKSLMAGGLNFDQARAQLAEDASTKAFFLAGIATGVFGGMGDRVLAKAMTGQLKGGIAMRAGKGAAGEGVFEELPQSALQQASQNVAMQEAQPDTPITKDVLHQGAGGLALGALQGGAQTAIFGHGAMPAPAPSAAPAPPSPDAQATPGAPVEPPPGSAEVGAPGSGVFTASLQPIDQARADAQVLKSGGNLLDADETRQKNATLVAVYGENAAVRHVIEGGPQFAALGDAMLMAAPTVDRVRGTIQAGQGRDITEDILGAIDELTKAKDAGHSVAQIMAHGVSHDISYEGQMLMQFLSDNAGNSQKIANFLEAYLQEVENASGVPSQVRGRAFDIIEEQRLAKKKAQEDAAIEEKKQTEAKAKRTEEFKATEQHRAETVLTEMAKAKASGSGLSTEPTAMELAFKAAQEKRNAKPGSSSSGTVPPTTRGNPPSGPGQGEGASGEHARPVPKPAETVDAGNARSVRAEGDRGSAEEGRVNRGAAIAAERKSAIIDSASGGQTHSNVAGTLPAVESVAPDVSVAPVDAAAHEAATSPQNELPAPTQAQIEAGNYTKGHPTVGSLDISVENPAGSKRRPEWPTLQSHYGYVRGVPARSPDKEHVDVFVKPGTAEDYNGPVFVVDQNKADGSFDESKSMVGFKTEKEARSAYLKNYTKGFESRIRGVTEMTLGQFKAKLQDAQAFLRPQVVTTPEPTAQALLPSAAPVSAAFGVKDIPTSMKIMLPVTIEETGETGSIEISARKAFGAAQRKVNRLTSLLECLT